MALSGTNLATAIVRLRAFLEAVRRDEYPDGPGGELVLNIAPTEQGAVAPLYAEDVQAALDFISNTRFEIGTELHRSIEAMNSADIVRISSDTYHKQAMLLAYGLQDAEISDTVAVRAEDGTLLSVDLTPAAEGPPWQAPEVCDATRGDDTRCWHPECSQPDRTNHYHCGNCKARDITSMMGHFKNGAFTCVQKEENNREDV